MRQTRPTFFLRISLRLIVGLALLVVPASLLPLAGADAQTAGALFEQVGTLDRFPADARAVLGSRLVPQYKDADAFQRAMGGTMFLVPEMRQIWQIYLSPQADFPPVYGAVVRDLDSLKILATLNLPSGLERATIHAIAGEWSHAVDPRGRLFLLEAGNALILEVDLRTFAVTTRALWAGATGLPQGAGLFNLTTVMPGGLTYDPFTDDLLVLYGGPQSNSAADTNTFLYTMDVSVPPAPFNPAGFHQLQSCTGPLSSVDAGGTTYGWEILTMREYLYIPCHRAGNAGAVVRTVRPGSVGARPREDVVIGPVYVETVMADPGSGRLFLATIEREIWVFDAETMSYLGIVATGPERTQLPTGYGLDRQTGRIFFQSPTFGLGVAEGRFFPLPQARTMARKVNGHERIVSDTATNRVFVLEGVDTDRPAAYRIYRTGAAPVPPPKPDPDRNTADVEEKEGVTEPRYFANASGYGTRILLAKGLAPVVPAPTAGIVAPTAQVIDDNLSSKCGYTDRELVSGRVRKAEYDTGSTAAAAIAFDVDGATKQDLDKPSRCDITARDHAGTERFRGVFTTAPQDLDKATQAPQDDPDTPETDESRPRWTMDQAECTNSQGDNEAKDKPAKTQTLGPSTTQCPKPGGTLVAKAYGGQLQGGLFVAKSWTETKIELTSAGVKSTVTAVAQGVDIAGAIQFGEIRSTATSVSNGRVPTKDMSTHDIVVRGAVLNGTSLCENCVNLTALVDTLNLAVSGKAIFRTGKGANSGLDEELKRGSPRGALTAVQKSAARQASDRALVGDFTTEVPGLELTVFNDNTQWGRARQVYQFAGVASAATYNIVVRPTGFGLTDDDPGLPDDLEVGEIGNTPFAGMVEGISGPADITSVVRTSRGGNGGGILAPFRALARGIRLFFTNPRHSLLLLTAWALFSLPGVLSRRRRLLADVRSG